MDIVRFAMAVDAARIALMNAAPGRSLDTAVARAAALGIRQRRKIRRVMFRVDIGVTIAAYEIRMRRRIEDDVLVAIGTVDLLRLRRKCLYEYQRAGENLGQARETSRGMHGLLLPLFGALTP